MKQIIKRFAQYHIGSYCMLYSYLYGWYETDPNCQQL